MIKKFVVDTKDANPDYQESDIFLVRPSKSTSRGASRKPDISTA
jgi:hypothetical protein